MKVFERVFEFLKDKKEKLKQLIATSHLLRVVLFTLLVVFLIEGGMAFNELYYSKEPTKDVQFCSKDVAELPDGEQCTFLYFLPLKVVSYTAQTSVLLMTMVFLYLSVYAEEHWKAKKTKEQNSSGEEHQSSSTGKVYYDYFAIYLAEVFIGSLSISALPTGISLIICGIYGGKPMQLMSGMEIYIAFAGISLAALAFLGALQEQGEIQKGKDMFKETKDDPKKLQNGVINTNETSSQNNTPDAMVTKFC